MTTFLLFYFTHGGGGSMRKAMQAAGVAFEVKDIPRQPRSGCGLCILLRGRKPMREAGSSRNRRRRCISRTGSMALSRHLPTCRLIAHHKRVAAKQFSRRCMRKTRVSVTTSETVTEVMRYRSLNTRS